MRVRVCVCVCACARACVYARAFVPHYNNTMLMSSIDLSNVVRTEVRGTNLDAQSAECDNLYCYL